MYIFWGIAIIIVVGLILLFIRSNRERSKYQSAVNRYIDEIFSGQTYRPEVKAGWTYGIPSFTLRFKSEEQKNHAQANGLTSSFLEKVQKLCSNIRPRGEEFDAKLAVDVFSEDDEKRWAQQAASLRKNIRR